MANQNLSQFGEKLFVADADHTFIWDTAASISKRVSRNSWLNSGTLTSDAPVTISQTWGTTGTYTAFKIVVTETLGAAAASNLLELWSGSAPALKLGIKKGGSIISKVGVIAAAGTANASGLSLELFFPGCGLGIDNNGSTQFFIDGTAKTRCGLGVVVASDQAIAWSSTTHTGLGVASDTILLRDSASGNTLALRNGTSAQTFRVYGAYPDTGINYARLALSCDTSGNATISTQALGTYTAGTVSINGVPVGLGRLNFVTNLAIGVSALASNTLTTLGANVAVGDGSLTASTQTYWSTAIGYRALAGLTGFSNSNVAVGYEAGAQITSGANSQCSTSVFIGFNSKALGNNQNNQIVIGASAIGIGENSVVLGNDSITKTALKGNVGIGTTSPTSKLQVTNGDVEIETVTSGIIMKAAGTANRYRITLNAGGTDFVITAL